VFLEKSINLCQFILTKFRAMTKSIEFLTFATRSMVAAMCLLGMLFVAGCDSDGDEGDPEPELYDLTGVYTFNEAILRTTLAIPGVPISFPAGTPITDQMASGLLAEAPCDDAANGAVELKAGGKLFFACVGESNELDAGTWAVNEDRTELTLNLAVSTGNLALILTELTIDENEDIIGGKIADFPITKTLIAGFLIGIPGADGILAGIPDNFTILVNVDIKFEKVS